MSQFASTRDPAVADPSYPNVQTTTNVNPQSRLSDTQATTGNNTSAAYNTASSKLQDAHATVSNNASAAYNTVKNHPLTQSVTNGPVAENVSEQAAKTQSEFSNLAASRTTPAETAATGQQLTHYHSFFGTLLSWENPRASGIAFISLVAFIFTARYLNILRYAMKLTWVTLGVTVLAEIAGKAVLSHGLMSHFRPNQYYTLPRDALDSILGDVHELINFFVIESQRILFAENVYASAAVCVAAFLSYYLVKIVPFWGLALIGSSVLFLTPLVYKNNKELIDHHMNNAATVANQQSQQVKALASHHAARATETTKQYVGDYSNKAQGMINNARGRNTSPTATTKPGSTTSSVPSASATGTSFKSSDFPAAPRDEFKVGPTVGSGNTLGTTRNQPGVATSDPLIAT